MHQALVRKPGSEAGGWLEQVKGTLERSALGRPDLSAVAKSVGTSEQVLRKRFRALTGQSPHQWYGGIQMCRACDLLKGAR